MIVSVMSKIINHQVNLNIKKIYIDFIKNIKNNRENNVVNAFPVELNSEDNYNDFLKYLVKDWQEQLQKDKKTDAVLSETLLDLMTVLPNNIQLETGLTHKIAFLFYIYENKEKIKRFEKKFQLPNEIKVTVLNLLIAQQKLTTAFDLFIQDPSVHPNILLTIFMKGLKAQWQNREYLAKVNEFYDFIEKNVPDYNFQVRSISKANLLTALVYNFQSCNEKTELMLKIYKKVPMPWEPFYIQNESKQIVLVSLKDEQVIKDRFAQDVCLLHKIELENSLGNNNINNRKISHSKIKI